ncbi:transcription factor mef2A [Condylostylus longicornis]|uniref:transcription factor mef2A n=1 Tax=Condylostylus longicornis TaxID=2530218 RepID=UPI00244E1347|nr:transcription factor mef2A [Condylostylus longicornis]XP_055371036.1 transcription factor mef2A [Condylostylus longicornis]XP_055371037.1 transcription factor mef2A [Condylostylus longicornis]XP_055371039.1 transcription factor mef2A [Condylostylus longicornis]XP_055371040.1 transcription factor mef2A [Condylostylus longicornis]XP_055371041.1 transcription factor mef2A [Condylostylus longicornis]XP_055371042.1 transcription factor mef2A [Condylostylus longicornis]
MLSAVETFGPAAASATNAYAAAAAQQHQHHTSHHHLQHQHHHHQLAHHNPFALAAAAAAAASVVMPPTQGQTETNQLSLDHYSIAGHGPLLTHHPHLNSHPHHLSHLNHLTHPSGIYLSSLPSVIPPSTTAAVTSSMSFLHQQQQHQSVTTSTLLQSPSLSSSVSYSNSSINSTISPCSSPAKSPSSSTIRSNKDSINASSVINNNNSQNNLTIDSKKTSSAMSITEFARPHPKQPRYSNASNGININSNLNSNNNNISNSSSNNNSTIGSNGIPLLGRKISSPLSETVNGSRNSLSKYSNEPPQTGPVNLVTNNNNNSNSRDYSKGFNKETNNNNRITPPTAISDLDLKKTSVSAADITSSNEIKDNLCTMTNSYYSQKIQFTPPPPTLAAAYQFNYPHLYARGGLYGTSALYSGHHSPLNGRNRSPAFLNSAHPDLQPFSPYISPTVVYSPPNSNTSTTHVATNAVSTSLIPQQPVSSSLAITNSANMNLTNENLPKSPSQQQMPLQLPLSPSQQNSPNSQQQLLPPSSSSQNFMQQSSSLPQSNFITAVEQQRALLGQNSSQHHQTSYYHPYHQTDKNGGSGLKLSTNNNNSNDKKSHQSNNDGASFKVPSGKEGSLKHRFLTRPKSDRDLRRRSPNSVNRSPNNSSGNHSPSNFTKGSYIELANGLLRRVEDMRTEDFLNSAEKSERHQIIDSTVVKISNTLNSVIITFSYDKNRSKADIDVSQEHPFFVYGQGWASCNPDLSLQNFGLKCKRLQVGDVCISLIETSSPTTSSYSSSSSLSSLSTLSAGKNPSSSSCSSSCSSDSCITNSPSASPIIDVTTVVPQNLTTTSASVTRPTIELNTAIDIKHQESQYNHNALQQMSSYDAHNNLQQTHYNQHQTKLTSYDETISKHQANNNNNQSESNKNNNKNSNNDNGNISNNASLHLKNELNNNNSDRDIVNNQHHHNQLSPHHQNLDSSHRLTGKHSSHSDSHYLIPSALQPPPLPLQSPIVTLPHQQQQIKSTATKNVEFTFSSRPIHHQHLHLQQQEQPFYLGKSATFPPISRSASPPSQSVFNHHHCQQQKALESHNIPTYDPEITISRKRRWSAPEDKCGDDNGNKIENNNGERRKKFNAYETNNNLNSENDN